MHRHDWRCTNLSRSLGISLIYPGVPMTPPVEASSSITDVTPTSASNNFCSLLPLFLPFFGHIFAVSPPPSRGLFLGSVYRLSCRKCVISLLLWVYFLKKTHLLLCLTSYFTHVSFSFFKTEKYGFLYLYLPKMNVINNHISPPTWKQNCVVLLSIFTSNKPSVCLLCLLHDNTLPTLM